MSEHNPGGMRRFRLPAGVAAGCEMSSCKRYRPRLWRQWADMDRHRSILWIGLNPSTASSDMDDPTILREWNFSQAWGFSRYVKCNLSDYRATKPLDLVRFIDAGGDPWSPVNMRAILEEAEGAERIMMAHGHPPRELLGVAFAVTADLIRAGHAPKLMCLGLTGGGFPRHPLYVSGGTNPEEYRECPKPK